MDYIAYVTLAFESDETDMDKLEEQIETLLQPLERGDLSPLNNDDISISLIDVGVEED